MSKKNKSLKAIPCEELNEKQIELLYKFLQDKDTIYNKDRSLSSSILWDVIYLRKIFSKSVYSRKSGKYRAKYNYVILEDDKIITFFTLHHISKKTDLNILELQTILDKSLLSHVKQDMMLDINNLMILEFNKISSGFLVNTVLTIYIPVSNDNLNNLANLANQANQEEDNKGLSLIFIDNQTFKETYNIYYKLYTQQNTHPNEEITTGYITNKLLEHYGLNTIINPTRELSGKLTRKSIAIPDIKIITKNIFDIKEIQNLPEYDYDFDKMYLIMDIYSLIYYIFNKRNNITENIIMERFFPENTIYFNKKLYDIYFNIYTRYYDVLSSFKIKDIFFNNLVNIINNYKLPFSRYIGDNLKIITHFKPNRLILTGSRTEIEYFSNYKCDIINIKNQIKNYEIFKERKKKYPNIINAFNFNELKDAFTNLKNRYDNIYINSLYINYDYHIKSIHLYIKIQYISYLLLSSLDSLNNNGSMILRFIDGNKIDIPFFKKIIGIIVNLFDSYKIHDYTDLFYIIIEFKKFNVNKYKTNKNIIQRLLKEIHKYEHNEYNLDNAMTCLLTNKFYYKMESELIEKYKINMRLKHILYDFNVIDNDINFFNNKTKQFVIEFNNLIDNKINILNKIYNDIYKYENNKIIFTNKIIKYLLYRIINIFKIYRDNDLFNSLDLDLFLEKFNKQYKNIYEYMDINIKN
jgi:hypothetical protein